MTTAYIISQVLALIALIINVVSRYFKKQANGILFNALTNLFLMASCIFLTAYVGMAGCFVSAVRAFVFYIYAKKNWDRKLWLIIFFILLQFALCILTGFIDEFIWWAIILIMVKSTIFAYGCWQHNLKVFRICGIISCSLSATYYLIYMGYIKTENTIEVVEEENKEPINSN